MTVPPIKSLPPTAPRFPAASDARTVSAPGPASALPTSASSLALRLSDLAEALSTACAADRELIGMTAVDPAVSGWRAESEAAWAAAWARAEALAMIPEDTSAARWGRRLGRSVIDVLDADEPAPVRASLQQITQSLGARPPSLRHLDRGPLARLRSGLGSLAGLCDLAENAIALRTGASPG